MTDQVLFVDDESSVLDGYRRLLQRHFRIETAKGGNDGLTMIEQLGPFAVVVSDMRMPGMNGAEFLCHVRLRAPETVRMLLTGHADVSAAIEAVNKGNIFRYLTKPCSKEALVDAINLGIAQYHSTLTVNSLAERGRVATSGSWDPLDAPFDNTGNAAALPGPVQARVYLAGLGEGCDFHAVLFRFGSPAVVPPWNRNQISECLRVAAGFLQDSLSVDDRLYRWEEHTLMALLRRSCTPEKLRTEVELLTSMTRNYLSGIRKDALSASFSLEFEIRPASALTTSPALSAPQAATADLNAVP